MLQAPEWAFWLSWYLTSSVATHVQEDFAHIVPTVTDEIIYEVSDFWLRVTRFCATWTFISQHWQYRSIWTFDVICCGWSAVLPARYCGTQKKTRLNIHLYKIRISRYSFSTNISLLITLNQTRLRLWFDLFGWNWTSWQQFRHRLLP